VARKGLLGLVFAVLLISVFFTYYILNAKPPSASAKTKQTSRFPLSKAVIVGMGY
jgi:hypothetical protein